MEQEAIDSVLSRYAEVQLLRRNDRFAVYQLAGSKLAKFALQKNLFDKAANEVWSSQFINSLEIDLRCPVIEDAGTGWYVREYFDTAPLTSQEKPKESDILPYIKRLATALAQLDQVSGLSRGQLIYDEDGETYSDLMEKVEKWMEEPLANGAITQDTVDRLKALVNTHLSDIKSSFAHGDFVPWHIFDLGDKLGVVDGEHARLNKPRFYDLAYLYCRIYTRVSPAAAARLLNEFLAQSTVPAEVFKRAFLPVITLRSLGMFYDALHDVIEYTNRAQELATKCLTEQIESFL